VLWDPTATAYQSENGIPNDWLNENVSQLVAEHVSSVNGSCTFSDTS